VFAFRLVRVTGCLRFASEKAASAMSKELEVLANRRLIQHVDVRTDGTR